MVNINFSPHSSDHCEMSLDLSRYVTKFTFEFDDVLTLNVLSRSEIQRFFSRPIVEFECQVYRHRMFTQTGHRNKLTTNARCLKGPKMILNMADRYVSKDDI